jgi:hypothetical protein
MEQPLAHIFQTLFQHEVFYSRALLILGSNFNSTVRVEITPFWGVKKIEYISLQNRG